MESRALEDAVDGGGVEMKGGSSLGNKQGLCPSRGAGAGAARPW